MLRATPLLLVLVALPAIAEPTAGELVKQQLDNDDDRLRLTFAADALVILPASVTTGALPVDKLEWFVRSDEVSFDPSKAGKPIAGKRGEVSWVTVDIVQPWQIIVDCPVGAARCKRSRTLRMTELVVGGKVVAAHIDDPALLKKAPAAPQPFEPATAAGPLTALLTDPKALAAALLDDPATVVLGTEKAERAVGVAAAKKLAATWSKLELSLDGKSRELVKGTWGYAAGNVAWKASKTKTVTMRASVFVVKVGNDWKVVAAHYSLPYERTMYGVDGE